jgi:hypothetical protein
MSQSAWYSRCSRINGGGRSGSRELASGMGENAE